MSRFSLERVRLDEANAFVDRLHRHHDPVVGHLFSIGATEAGKLVGVAIVGRPVSRMRDDFITAEVTRLCTDGTKDACSIVHEVFCGVGAPDDQITVALANLGITKQIKGAFEFIEICKAEGRPLQSRFMQ